MPNGSWSTTNELLAMLINSFQHWKWMHADERKRGPYEPLIHRPYMNAAKQQDAVRGAGVDRAQADSWLQQRLASLKPAK